MELLLVNPQHVVRKGEIASLCIQGCFGEIEILPNHVSLFASLAPGLIHIKDKSGAIESFFADKGFVFFQDNVAKVSAEKIESKGELDLSRTKAASDRAHQRLAFRDDNSVEIGRALASLARAKARQKLASK